MNEEDAPKPTADEETKVPEAPPAPEVPPAPEAAPDPVAQSSGMSANTWAMLTHLAGLTGYIFPVAGNILGPLIVWIIKKDEIPEVDRHGKAALNFQISFLIWITVATAVAFALTFVLIGFVLLPLVGTAGVIVMILFPILAGMRANEGGWYEYPWTIQFLK